MGLLDKLTGKEALEQENADLREKLQTAEAELTEARRTARDVERALISKRAELDRLDREIREKSGILEKISFDIKDANTRVKEIRADIIELEEEALLQNFGLYRPMYAFATSEEYKDKLEECRNKQKALLHANAAAVCYTPWTVNDNRDKGMKMVNDTITQVVLMFNTECENAISRVTFSNFDSMKKRITRMYDKLNRLNKTLGITITQKYLDLKYEELSLAHEYAMKKQEEKEYIREQREIARENAKVQKELEAERRRLEKAIEKEQAHYENLRERLTEQLTQTDVNNPIRQDIEEKLWNAQTKISELEDSLKQVDYRQANQRAGYVYVISNVGAFGEGVYKIGMTRRLDPQDRIDELASASVPFKFDVHAMIFSDDAPKLETALHNAFADRRVNMVNSRKEFYRVPLQEIAAVVKENHDRTVDFNYRTPAQQFRESERIRAGDMPAAVTSPRSPLSAVPAPQEMPGIQKAAATYIKEKAHSLASLIAQLQSDGFPAPAAEAAAKKCGADWFQQSIRAAEEEIQQKTVHSKEEMISALQNRGFTPAQSHYAAAQVGY